MSAQIPIGIDDFRELREARLEYVDKSHLILELLDRTGEQVVLFPRPRRFGKTLNLSMLRWFFEKRDEDVSHLFDGLAVWQAGEAYRAHFQRYPVIHVTLKGSKADSFDACWAVIVKKITQLYKEHRYVLDGGQLDEVDARTYQEILDGNASWATLARSLLDLSAHLHRHHGEKVVLLLDEYDEPIHAGYVHGYAPQILNFCRAFLTEGLKGNPHLFKAVLTGILRVARESIFSGLNNLAVHSLLRSEFSTAFGFTELEVVALLDRAGRRDQLDVVRHWYNGYLFGDTVIYNPWSVLSFLADAKAEPRPHWLATSSNDLIKQLLDGRAARLQPIFEALLAGGGIERVLDENVVLDQLARQDDALWGLLVFSGYLKAERRPRGRMDQAAHFLSIPNYEVRLLYTGTFREWMHDRMIERGADLDRLTAALLGGDADTLEEQLQAFAQNVLSYHDAAPPSPEQLYQGFVLGLLAVLEPGHRVRSNRESGKGRPDVLITPTQPGAPGALLELKVAKRGKKTLAQALQEGVQQIRGNDYAAELRTTGATPVHAFAVAFDGKRVRVRAVEQRTTRARKGMTRGPKQRPTR